ncbi:hypothetical protein AB205_0190820, partial [Aquarana catesbeiana]
MAEYGWVSLSIAEYGRVLWSIAEYCRVLKSIAGYCRVLRGMAEYCRVLRGIAEYCGVLQSIADNFMSQLVDSPTRKNALLDILITNYPSLVSDVDIRDNLGSSDYRMITFN